MESRSMESLQNRVRELEGQVSLYQKHICHLESQNSQLMGIVVQTSNHEVSKTN
jgi:phage-related minor tail protein